MLQMYCLLFRNKAVTYGVFHQDILNRYLRLGARFGVFFLVALLTATCKQPEADIQEQSNYNDA